MLLEDRVHGEVDVDEKVLKELIDSEPVQRLREIHQAGPLPFFTDKEHITRFQHSIGVFVLLRQHDASLEEQIAGLLHDVPHTAFSHTVDFVYQTEDHDYHDDFLEEIVVDSEIPEILERHGIDLEDVLDESRFGLLEQDSPLLCADRIDYFLRDSKLLLDTDVEDYLEALRVRDGMFVLEGREVAEQYALDFVDADRHLWANPVEVAINELFADIVREALDKNILTQEDLFSTDREVMQKLRESDDDFIDSRFDILENQRFEIVEDDPDFVGHTKARYVDPPVLDRNEIVRVTDYSDKLEREIMEHRKEVEDGFPVRID